MTPTTNRSANIAPALTGAMRGRLARARAILELHAVATAALVYRADYGIELAPGDSTDELTRAAGEPSTGRAR